MKRLVTLFLIATVTMFFYSCSEKSSTVTGLEQNDQLVQPMAKKITQFTGTCTLIHFAPENAWYDLTNDARVTGVTVWITEGTEPLGKKTTKLWGTAELFVDGMHVGEMNMDLEAT